jgi:diadenosine tetraphosphate (Ap4A) HIT family hydrolase
MACPFCKIDTEVSRVVFTTRRIQGVLSNPRLVRGHLLIMPRRHIESPWNMTKEERAEIQECVLFYQERISKRLAPGCDVRQNYRPFIPEGRLKVNHVHFHLLPRWPAEQDELYQRSMKYEKDIFAPLSGEERDEFTDLYKR